MAKEFYIKERHNPQFDKPYYVPCGQLTKKEAREAEDSLYGYNIMIPFPSKDEYEKAIEKYKSDGFNVHN